MKNSIFKTAGSLYDELIAKMDNLAKTAEETTPAEGVISEETLPPVDELVKALEEEAAKGEKEDKVISNDEPVKEAKEEIKGDGGHVPDGTGPHGQGNGPGKGQADGSGLEADVIKTKVEEEDDPKKEGYTAKEAADKMYDASMSYVGKSMVAMRKEAGIPLLNVLKNLSLKDAARASNIVAGGLGGAAGIYYGGKREESKDAVEDDMIYNVGIRNGAVAMANAITERLNAQAGNTGVPAEGALNV